MIAQLLNIPIDENTWNIWSWHHRLSHDQIREAARAQGKELNGYQLDPIPPDDLVDWLERNQQAHVEMNSAVGAQGVDLQDVDLRDPGQHEAWSWLHYLEHQNVEQQLGIGS